MTERLYLRNGDALNGLRVTVDIPGLTTGERDLIADGRTEQLRDLFECFMDNFEALDMRLGDEGVELCSDGTLAKVVATDLCDGEWWLATTWIAIMDDDTPVDARFERWAHFLDADEPVVDLRLRARVKGGFGTVDVVPRAGWDENRTAEAVPPCPRGHRALVGATLFGEQVECSEPGCGIRGPAAATTAEAVALWGRMEIVPEWRHDKPDQERHHAIEMQGDANLVVRLRWTNSLWQDRWYIVGPASERLLWVEVTKVMVCGWRPARGAPSSATLVE